MRNSFQTNKYYAQILSFVLLINLVVLVEASSQNFAKSDVISKLGANNEPVDAVDFDDAKDSVLQQRMRELMKENGDSDADGVSGEGEDGFLVPVEEG